MTFIIFKHLVIGSDDNYPAGDTYNYISWGNFTDTKQIGKLTKHHMKRYISLLHPTRSLSPPKTLPKRKYISERTSWCCYVTFFTYFSRYTYKKQKNCSFHSEMRLEIGIAVSFNGLQERSLLLHVFPANVQHQIRRNYLFRMNLWKILDLGLEVTFFI